MIGAIAAGIALIVLALWIALTVAGLAGVGAFVAWLVALVVVWALLGSETEREVDHSERPADVLETARNKEED